MNQLRLFGTYLKGKLRERQIKGSVMVEAILVLVVLIALVAIFKTQLITLVGVIFDKITRQGTGI